MTIAETVAETAGNDGLKFLGVDGGPGLYALIQKHDGETHAGDDHDVARYAFSDGSAIVVAGDAWDIEGSEPFSWAGAR